MSIGGVPGAGASSSLPADTSSGKPQGAGDAFAALIDLLSLPADAAGAQAGQRGGGSAHGRARFANGAATGDHVGGRAQVAARDSGKHDGDAGFWGVSPWPLSPALPYVPQVSLDASSSFAALSGGSQDPSDTDAADVPAAESALASDVASAGTGTSWGHGGRWRGGLGAASLAGSVVGAPAFAGFDAAVVAGFDAAARGEDPSNAADTNSVSPGDPSAAPGAHNALFLSSGDVSEKASSPSGPGKPDSPAGAGGATGRDRDAVQTRRDDRHQSSVSDSELPPWIGAQSLPLTNGAGASAFQEGDLQSDGQSESTPGETSSDRIGEAPLGADWTRRQPGLGVAVRPAAGLTPPGASARAAAQSAPGSSGPSTFAAWLLANAERASSDVQAGDASNAPAGGPTGQGFGSESPASLADGFSGLNPAGSPIVGRQAGIGPRGTTPPVTRAVTSQTTATAFDATTDRATPNATTAAPERPASSEHRSAAALPRVNLPAGDANGAATWPVEPETNDIRQWREAERTSASAPSVAFARASARADSGDGGSAAPGRRAFTGSSWSSVIGQTVLPASGPSSVAAGEFLDVSGPPAPIDDHALEAHVVQAIKMQWQTGVGEATIKLRPEHLGEMTVSLRVEGGSVSADLRVETEAARSWISGHEDNLRSALERQGLTLDRIVVSQEDAAPDRRQQPERRRQQPRPRRQNAAAPGFEILA